MSERAPVDLGKLALDAIELIAPGEDWADVMPPVVPSRSSSASGLRVGHFRLHAESIDRPETLRVRGRQRGFALGVTPDKSTNEILKKASAYFAQAELDRRARWWCD